MYRLAVIMKRPQSIFFAVLLLCGIFLAINFLPLLASSQTPSGKTLNRQGSLEAPLVRFSQANTHDAVDRVLRLSRNSRYDKSASKPFDQLPPEATSSGLVSEWDAYLPALPTAQSDAIILGEILDAGAFLSNDKTGAYSEFTVNVVEVLKNNGSLNDGRLTVERQGAKVELPSGRVFDVEVIGQRMPQVDHRYILFLNYNKETKDYFVLTGYEVAGEKVSPLDTIQNFAIYENVDAKRFLSDLESALRNPSPKPIKKEKQQ
jgi:hypothetical protein